MNILGDVKSTQGRKEGPGEGTSPRKRAKAGGTRQPRNSSRIVKLSMRKPIETPDAGTRHATSKVNDAPTSHKGYHIRFGIFARVGASLCNANPKGKVGGWRGWGWVGTHAPSGRMGRKSIK